MTDEDLITSISQELSDADVEGITVTEIGEPQALPVMIQTWKLLDCRDYGILIKGIPKVRRS